jgi:outer membrane protein TolC
MGRSPAQPVRAQASTLQVLELSADAAKVSHATELPEVLSQESLIASRREAYDAAIGARLPTMGVTANASISYLDVLHGQGIDGHQYGGAGLLFLRWNGIDPTIWTRANVADAQLAEAQRQLDVVRHTMDSQEVAATQALAGARIELERAAEILRASEETRVAQNGRYRAGVASLIELLDAEGQEQQARRRRIEAQRDYQLASARLLWVSGRLGTLAK